MHHMADPKLAQLQNDHLLICGMRRALPWLEARELVRERGGLPSNVQFDDMLRGLLRQKGVVLSFSPASGRAISNFDHWWSRNVIVYPAAGSHFARGHDIVDTLSDKLAISPKSWVFPAACVPESAIGRKNVALFIDPESVTVAQDRVIIEARRELVAVLEHFGDKSEFSGPVDKATRIPQAKDLGANPQSSPMRGRIWRHVCDGVRPIARPAADTLSTAIVTDAGYSPSNSFGVSYIDADFDAIIKDGRKVLERLRRR